MELHVLAAGLAAGITATGLAPSRDTSSATPPTSG
jgi:hypothetical protein